MQEIDKSTVVPPFVRISAEEVQRDAVLVGFVEKYKPDALMRIPDITGVIYLRINSRNYGYGYSVNEVELGVYYDERTHQLIDFEHRENKEIMPTAINLSLRLLRARQEGKREL